MLSYLKRFRKSRLFDLFRFLLISGAIILVLSLFAAGLPYTWHWYRVPRYILDTRQDPVRIGRLLQGLLVTLEISGVSLVLTFILGFLTAFLRLSNSLLARGAAKIYLELIRNTPLLIQLFLIYFVAAPVFGLSSFFSAVLALSLFEGAYASEIIRAGIAGIPRGQWESAYSLGLSGVTAYRRVILPQALKNVLPPLTSQAVSLVKDSALVSTIAIYDLTMQGQAIVSETFLTFEIWFTVAGIYLIITLALSQTVHRLESRLRRN